MAGKTIDDFRSENNMPVDPHATMTMQRGVQAEFNGRDCDEACQRGDYSGLMSSSSNDWRDRNRMERPGSFGGSTINKATDLD